MTYFGGTETKKMLGEIDGVVKQHLTKQMHKIIKENNFLKQNITLLKELPIIKKYEDDLKKLRQTNKTLMKNLVKMKKKLDEYENYANLNLEIKEITRDPSQILKLDCTNWQQLILENDMETMGLTYSDEEEDDDDEEEDEDEEDDDDEEGDDGEDGEDGDDGGDGDDDDDDDGGGGHPGWGGGNDEPISIEHDIAAEDNEISDEEEEPKEWIWEETGDKYFIENQENGKIFENINGKIGKVVGRLEEGVAFFS